MRSSKNILFGAVLVIGAVVFFQMSRAPAKSADAAFQGDPEIIAATFASAWCSSCKIMKPRLLEVIPDFTDKPVTFVELDFTFGERAEQQAIADDNGFSELYAHYKGATGFTILIDAETGKAIDTLTMNHSAAAMRTAIAQAIAVAAKPAAMDAALEN